MKTDQRCTRLCHFCLQPSNLPHYCPNCATLKYCSEKCRANDWNEGGHSTRCNFMSQCLGGPLQIGCGDLPFRCYGIQGLGDEMYVKTGTVGRVELMPHEVDAGGSLVLALADSPTRILVDVFALEAAPIQKFLDWNDSEDAFSLSQSIWEIGLSNWFQGDFRQAMQNFEESLEVFKFGDLEKGSEMSVAVGSCFSKKDLRKDISRK